MKFILYFYEFNCIFYEYSNLKQIIWKFKSEIEIRKIKWGTVHTPIWHKAFGPPSASACCVQRPKAAATARAVQRVRP
jgi:hypothetical protein